MKVNPSTPRTPRTPRSLRNADTGGKPPGLFPHQEAERDALKLQDRGFLFSQTGTGKTPVLLSLAGETLRNGGRVLWVTEAGLITQLVTETGVWLPHLDPPALDKDLHDPGKPWVAVSHDWIGRNHDKLQQPSFDLVIVDEAHATGAGGENRRAAQYLGIRNAVRKAPRSVLATATPVASMHGLDLYALLEAGDAPGLISRTAFDKYVAYTLEDNHYGGKRRQNNGLYADGVTYLQQVVASCAVATRLEDLDHANATLPHLTRVDRRVPLSPERRAYYDHVMTTYSGLKRHQKAVAAAIDHDDFTRYAVDQVLRLRSDGHRHVLMYAPKFDLLDPIDTMLRAQGIPVWRITGKDSAKQRSKNLTAHIASPFGVLLGTAALETGLNLQHCSALISVDASWSHSREIQREGRVRRTGSPHEEVLHIVIGPDVPLEDRKADRVQDKATLLEQIMSAVPRPHDALARRGIRS